MKLLKCSLLLMASAATLLVPGFANAVPQDPSQRCGYPANAKLPPAGVQIVPTCPARPTTLAPMGQQYLYSPAPAPVGSWELRPVQPPQPQGQGGQGQGSTPQGQVSIQSFSGQAPKSEGSTTDVCVQEDNTWYALDGSISGSYSVTGNEISLSGNSDVTGLSTVLTVLQPGVSMTGTLQEWSVVNPTADQAISTAIWTVNSPSCSE